LRDSDGITTYTTASGVTVTDQAMEFNPNNKSAHPVVVTLNNQTGSYAPKPLTSSQMSSPWATNLGNQVMYCSDCHGADSETSGDPKGPHGANVKYMLKGTGKYWPTKSDGTTLWRLNSTDAQNSQLFCRNCHPVWNTNNVHSKSDHNNKSYTIGGQSGTGIPCVGCHVAVPHGYKRSRLIGYNNADTPSPYNYGGNTLQMTGFKKTTPTGYNKDYCYSTATGCSSKHPDKGGYDP
jgi:hypothetical protein